MAALLVVLLPAAGAAVGPATPDEPVVVRVTVTGEQARALSSRYSVWNLRAVSAGGEALVAGPERTMLDDLRGRGLAPTVDVERTTALRSFRRAAAEAAAARGGAGIPGYPCYRTVDETFASLQALATSAPTLAAWTDVGDSLEKQDSGGVDGDDIFVLSITDPSAPGERAPFVLLAATHPREYVTTEVATRFAEALVEGHGEDPEITALLRSTEVHVVAIHNPDGRRLAEGVQPLRRKNLRAGTCPADADLSGVDLNRNSTQFFRFGVGWSADGCNEQYTGASAGSEPETAAVDALMSSVFADQRGELDDDPAPVAATGLLVSLHSFGELVLFPWEARSTDSPNHDGLRTLGRKFGHYLPDHDVCQDCLGTASGTNVDEAYGRYGVAAYTWELGTTFLQGCSLGDPSFEGHIWPEAREALLYAARAARRPYLEPAGPEVVGVQTSPHPVLAGAPFPVSGIADDTRHAFGSPAGASPTDVAPEPVQNVVAVYYSLDAAPWELMTLDSLPAADGVFDEPVEEFAGTVPTDGLDVGRHLLHLVAEDASGQMGVPTSVFLDVADPIFADGFESGDTGAWTP